MASAMFCPCETRTSTCRNFATISSGLWCFLGIWSSLMPKDILQVGPLQRGRISGLKTNLSVGTINPAYAVQDIADFNGDGKSDILFRHTSSGETALWTMNGNVNTSQ